MDKRKGDEKKTDRPWWSQRNPGSIFFPKLEEPKQIPDMFFIREGETITHHVLTNGFNIESKTIYGFPIHIHKSNYKANCGIFKIALDNINLAKDKLFYLGFDTSPQDDLNTTLTFRNKPTFSEKKPMKIKFVYTNGKSYTARNVTEYMASPEKVTYSNKETVNNIARVSNYSILINDLVYIEVHKVNRGLETIEIIKYKKTDLKISAPNILTDEQKAEIKLNKANKAELKAIKHQDKMLKLKKEKAAAKKSLKTKTVKKVK